MARDCPTLMNDHTMSACHAARRVSALARMDGRGGNLSLSEQTASGHKHLKEHLVQRMGGLDRKMTLHKMAEWI